MEYIEVEFADWPAENDNSEVARLKESIKELERIIERQTSRWGRIQHWYETADRSAHSWAELDRIMGDDDNDDE